MVTYFFVCIKVGDFATAMITCCQVPLMAASVLRICRAVAPSRARRREHTTKLVAGWCWLMVLHAVNPTVKPKMLKVNQPWYTTDPHRYTHQVIRYVFVDGFYCNILQYFYIHDFGRWLQLRSTETVFICFSNALSVSSTLLATFSWCTNLTSWLPSWLMYTYYQIIYLNVDPYLIALRVTCVLHVSNQPTWDKLSKEVPFHIPSIQ